MKNFLSSFMLLLLALNATAATQVNTETISGHWTLSGSPYLINNSVVVPANQSLVIDPGVEVIFTGFYEFNVQGTLYAVGTHQAPINFRSNDTTGWHDKNVSTGGWSGISLDYVENNDGSAMKYCNISDVKYVNNNSFSSKGAFKTLRPFTLDHCNFFHNQASKVVIDNGNSNLKLISCDIHDNLAKTSIISISSCPGESILRKNTIHDNYSAATILVTWVNNLNIDSNQINNNQCTLDAALKIMNCQGSISHNKIYNNSSEELAAVYLLKSNVDVNANLICNNVNTVNSVCVYTSGGGGIITIQGANTIRNNVIANNYTKYGGGGINLIWGSTMCINNTIVNNKTDFSAGGIFLYCTDTVTIKNNILYGNCCTNNLVNLAEVYLWSAQNLYFNNNWIDKPLSDAIYSTSSYNQLGSTTHNVVNNNPLLTNPTQTCDPTDSALNADFSLQLNSGCINKGNITGINNQSKDYAGNPRIDGGSVDIGAYEFVGSNPNDNPYTDENTDGNPTGISSQGVFNNGITVFPNPATDKMYIILPQAKGVLELTDLTGKIITQVKVNNTMMELNVGAFAKGVYSIIWRNDNNITSVNKLVIQ